jgi:phage protein D
VLTEPPLSDTIKLIPDCQVSLDGAKLSPEVEASLAKVDIDLDVDLFGQCVLTFNDPKLLLTNGEKFKPGAAIKVEIGFASSLTTVFEGEVVGLEPQFRRDLPLALRVVSQESLHRLALAQMTRSFQNVDDGEVVKQIAQENGLTGEGPSGTKEHVLQSNISDAVLLRRLAQKHGNHLSIDGKKLIIGPPPKGPQISITPDEALRKIKVKIKAGGQISEVTVHGYDPKTKREFVGTAKGQGEVGEGTRDYGKSSKLSFSGGEHQPTDQATAESMAKGRMRKLAEGHVVAHVNIVGNPELIPGADVSLE